MLPVLFHIARLPYFLGLASKEGGQFWRQQNSVFFLAYPSHARTPQAITINSMKCPPPQYILIFIPPETLPLSIIIGMNKLVFCVRMIHSLYKNNLWRPRQKEIYNFAFVLRDQIVWFSPFLPNFFFQLWFFFIFFFFLSPAFLLANASLYTQLWPSL